MLAPILGMPIWDTAILPTIPFGVVGRTKYIYAFGLREYKQDVPLVVIPRSFALAYFPYESANQAAPDSPTFCAGGQAPYKENWLLDTQHHGGRRRDQQTIPQYLSALIVTFCLLNNFLHSLAHYHPPIIVLVQLHWTLPLGHKSLGIGLRKQANHTSPPLISRRMGCVRPKQMNNWRGDVNNVWLLPVPGRQSGQSPLLHNQQDSFVRPQIIVCQTPARITQVLMAGVAGLDQQMPVSTLLAEGEGAALCIDWRRHFNASLTDSWTRRLAPGHASGPSPNAASSA